MVCTGLCRRNQVVPSHRFRTCYAAGDVERERGPEKTRVHAMACFQAYTCGLRKILDTWAEGARTKSKEESMLCTPKPQKTQCERS